MFRLIRKISHSVFPRSDRPWEDDPTSNAPHKAKKRRMSASEEPEPDMEQANKKKIRKESIASSVADTSETHDGPTTPPPQVETREVKEVTQGVKDVELEVGSAPESIPLPDEESDDLEDSPSNNSTPPPTTQLQGDVAVEQNATGDVTCRDEPEVNEDTTVTENATPVEKGQEAVEPSVLIVEEEVSDVPAGVAKSELARKLWSKPKEDASFSTA